MLFTRNYETTTNSEADLFIPGRFSFPEANDDGSLYLVASDASLWRADVAADTTSSGEYEHVIFAGGYSGMMTLSPRWPRDPEDDSELWIPNPQKGEKREADLMADRFAATTHALAQSGGRGFTGPVRIQRLSTTSIGDVRLSVKDGHLNPDSYADDPRRELHLVAGSAHARRFIGPLAVALDIPESRIRRVRMKDKYGAPKTSYLDAESAHIAFLNEQAAGVIHNAVMHSVKPRDLDGLYEAEEDFVGITKDPKAVARVLRHMPAAVLDAMLLTQRVHSNTIRSAGHLALVA
jgi:hypothetical protein